MKETPLPEKLEPCEHMTNLISARSDESLKGPAKWYTDFHVMTCPQCRTALQGLRYLHVQVKEMAEVSTAVVSLNEEEWRHVESEWDKGA